MTSSLANALIDPALSQAPHLNGNEDYYGADIKPIVEGSASQAGLKLEIPEQSLAAPANEDEDMQDLFGDDDEKEDVTRDDSAQPEQDGSEPLSPTEQQHRKNLEYEEDEGHEETVVELKHAVLSTPNIPMPRSSDGNTWVLKLPNFVKMDPKPFLKETYVGPDQMDDGSQAVNNREKSMSVKLEVENTLRWQWAKDEFGGDKRQSNSRIIRWSDGTMSLLLGKELFDINQTYESATTMPRRPSSAVLNSQQQQQSFPQSQSQQNIPSSQSQPPSSTPAANATTPGKSTAGLTYIVAQHKRPGILQTEAPVTGYMSLRPTGMQSETHRLLARAVGQKHSKVARLRIAPDPVVDPEREKAELIRQAARKPRARRGADGEGGSARKRRSYGRRTARESMWSDEEPEPGAFGESDEEDGEDGGGAFGGGGEGRKTRRNTGDDRRGAGEYQTDDFLVADSSEGEDGDGGGAGDSDEGGSRRQKRKGKKKRRSSADEDEDAQVDPLDEMDAKIERQQVAEDSRRKKREAGGEAGPAAVKTEKGEDRDAEGDVDMDVESEDDEEEEDFKVTRPGASGARKKRAIAIDEEDEE